MRQNALWKFGAILYAGTLLVAAPATFASSKPNTVHQTADLSTPQAQAVSTPADARPVNSMSQDSRNVRDVSTLMSNYSSLVQNLIQSESVTDGRMANLIQVMILFVLIITALVAGGGVFAFRLFKQQVEGWAVRHLNSRMIQIQTLASNTNLRFVSALEAFSSDQVRSKVNQLHRELTVRTPPDVSNILDAVAELSTYPVRLRDDIQAIAYRDEPASRQLARIRTLWAEVKAETASPESVRQLVLALIPLVESKPDSTVIVGALNVFERQLLALISRQQPLPSEPSF